MCIWWRVVVVAVLCCTRFAVAEAQEAVYEGRTISQWIADLNGEDPEERSAALWALSSAGPSAAPAVPALLKVLAEDADELRRMLAANALGSIGLASEEVLAALRKATNDPDEAVRNVAALSLAQLEALRGGATTVGPPATPPAEVVPPVGGTTAPAEPVAGAEGAYEPLVPEEEVRAAVQSAVLQSQSLGLLDADGNQLNPHVPPDAVSLLPEDLAAHVSITGGGGFRTIGDVIDFLASFDVRLAATGRAITVEDILPDLQSYVSWSFDNADEPRAGLGLTLASGPMLVRPETAPTMSENTPISSIASVMMLADLLIGVADGGDAGAMGERWDGSPRTEVRLAALADELPAMLAQGDAATAALTKIRGFITRIELDPNFVNLFIGAERLGMQRRLLVLFDCQNRLSVRLYEHRGQKMLYLPGVRAQWRKDGWWTVGGGLSFDRTNPIIVTARVGMGGSEWTGQGLPGFRYSTRLSWPRNYVWTQGTGETVRFLTGRITSFLGDHTPPPDVKIADAIGFLAHHPAETGPLVPGADVRLGPGHFGTPTEYRLEPVVGNELQFNVAVSRVPDQPMPVQRRLGVAFLGVRVRVSASEFLGFWMKNVEPMRVMGLTPAEDEALVRLATDRLLDTPCICCPIFLENATEEEPAEVASTDLLGELRIAPQAPWAVATHLKVAPGGTVSGFCALADTRANAQWTWREILGTFSGRLTERNPQFEAQRESGEGRNAFGRLNVGKLEAAGTWRGVGQPTGAAALQRGLTGTVSVIGTLMLDENDRYVAEGHVQFQEDDDWLSWTASAATWDEGLAAALKFEREHNFKSPFPRWEHPDWLEGQ